MREFALIKGLHIAMIFWRSKSHSTSAPILGNMWDVFRMIYYISYLKWLDSKDSDHFRSLSFWSSTWVQKTSADLGTSGCSFFQVEPCSPGLDVGCPEWCRKIVAVRGDKVHKWLACWVNATWATELWGRNPVIFRICCLGGQFQLIWQGA